MIVNDSIQELLHVYWFEKLWFALISFLFESLGWRSLSFSRISWISNTCGYTFFFPQNFWWIRFLFILLSEHNFLREKYELIFNKLLNTRGILISQKELHNRGYGNYSWKTQILCSTHHWQYKRRITLYELSTTSMTPFVFFLKQTFIKSKTLSGRD